MINKAIIILVIILCTIIVYNQYNYNKQLSNIKSELIKNNRELSQFKINQEKIKAEIILSISETNTKEVNKLNEKLNVLKNDLDTVKRVLIACQQQPENTKPISIVIPLPPKIIISKPSTSYLKNLENFQEKALMRLTNASNNP